MSKRAQKGDQVIIIAGNDRGKTGKILSCDGQKVIVEGVNLRKKHIKKSQERPKGQIIDVERPIQISNTQIAVDGKPVKLKVRFDNKGSKELYYKDGKKQVVYRTLKKAK